MTQFDQRSSSGAFARPWVHAVAVAVTRLGLVFFLLSGSAQAEVVTFDLDPAQSTGDLELTGLFNPTPGSGLNFQPATDTVGDSSPISGTLTLDVDVVGGSVQSVDFVSLTVDYDVTVVDRLEFLVTYLPGIFGTVGTETALYVLPFDQAQACGNPVVDVAPQFTLIEADKGTETGTGGVVELSGSTYRFEGTAQIFNDQFPLPACNGFPFQLAPFPSLSSWPGGPTDVNTLSGTVSVGPSGLEFTGSYWFSGVGGDGNGARGGLTHSGTIVAAQPSEVPVLGLVSTLSLLSGLGGLGWWTARRRNR